MRKPQRCLALLVGIERAPLQPAARRVRWIAAARATGACDATVQLLAPRRHCAQRLCTSPPIGTSALSAAQRVRTTRDARSQASACGTAPSVDRTRAGAQTHYRCWSASSVQPSRAALRVRSALLLICACSGSGPAAVPACVRYVHVLGTRTHWCAVGITPHTVA